MYLEQLVIWIRLIHYKLLTSIQAMYLKQLVIWMCLIHYELLTSKQAMYLKQSDIWICLIYHTLLTSIHLDQTGKQCTWRNRCIRGQVKTFEYVLFIKRFHHWLHNLDLLLTLTWNDLSIERLVWNLPCLVVVNIWIRLVH